MIKILFIGDVVGRPGRKIINEQLRPLIETEDVDIVIVNGENAATGSGITAKICDELYDAGANVITLGNHTWHNRDVFNAFETFDALVRPANYPDDTPGKGSYIAETPRGIKIGIINLLGQVYSMDSVNCPFAEATRQVEKLRRETNLIFVDMHADATSEKIAMGWFLDGKATAVVGTHTHVPTADERVLPGGTAYITDVGMTGPRDSVLGVKKEIILKKFTTKLPQRFEVAEGTIELCAVLIEADENIGKALSIKRIHLLSDDN